MIAGIPGNEFAFLSPQQPKLPPPSMSRQQDVDFVGCSMDGKNLLLVIPIHGAAGYRFRARSTQLQAFYRLCVEFTVANAIRSILNMLNDRRAPQQVVLVVRSQLRCGGHGAEIVPDIIAVSIG